MGGKLTKEEIEEIKKLNQGKIKAVEDGEIIKK